MWAADHVCAQSSVLEEGPGARRAQALHFPSSACCRFAQLWVHPRPSNDPDMETPSLSSPGYVPRGWDPSHQHVRTPVLRWGRGCCSREHEVQRQWQEMLPGVGGQKVSGRRTRFSSDQRRSVSRRGGGGRAVRAAGRCESWEASRPLSKHSRMPLAGFQESERHT